MGIFPKFSRFFLVMAPLKEDVYSASCACELELLLSSSLESTTTDGMGWGGRVGEMQNKAKLSQLRQWLGMGLS